MTMTIRPQSAVASTQPPPRSTSAKVSAEAGDSGFSALLGGLQAHQDDNLDASHHVGKPSAKRDIAQDDSAVASTIDDVENIDHSVLPDKASEPLVNPLGTQTPIAPRNGHRKPEGAELSDAENDAAGTLRGITEVESRTAGQRAAIQEASGATHSGKTQPRNQPAPQTGALDADTVTIPANKFGTAYDKPADELRTVTHQSPLPRKTAATPNTPKFDATEGAFGKAASANGKPATPSSVLDAKTLSFVRTLEDAVAIAKRFAQDASPGAAQTSDSLSTTGLSTSIAPSPLATVSPSPSSLGQPAIVPQLGVMPPMTHPNWAQAMSHQILSFLRTDERGAQVAQLRLDPPELGPLKVSIAIKDGVASASFVSANSAVRHAVEQALPQLAQQLHQSGLALGQTDVGERDAQNQGPFTDTEHTTGSRQPGHGAQDVRQSETVETAMARGPKGLIRAYA